LIAWITDLLWIILHTSSWWRRAKYDGDVELTLRRFVVIVTYFSILFKVFLLLIFWKLSIDFNRLVRSRNQLNESATMMGRNFI